MLSTPNPNLTWRRDLIGSKLVIWNNLTSRLATVALTHEDDEFWWNLDLTGVFSVKSHYWGLINQNVSNANKGLWKLKIPLNLILKYFFGTLNAVSFSQRIILRNETGKAINSVVSVMKIKRSNICFLTAGSLECYGLQYMRPGDYPNPTICLICSEVG